MSLDKGNGSGGRRFRLLWLQSGGCGGCTLSLLGAEGPDLLTAFEAANIEVLWHPSLSELSGQGVMNEAVTMSARSGSRPQVYEIRFKGHMSPYHAWVFEGFEMVQGPAGETVLTGPVIDQAALHGILNRIRDLGAPLLSVKRLLADEDSRPRGGSRTPSSPRLPDPS